MRLHIVPCLGALILVAISFPRPVQAQVTTMTETFGRSHGGAQLRATIHTNLTEGAAAPKRTVLVVGCLHGNECAGITVLRRLRRLGPPAGTRYILVDTTNPDGKARNIRQNGRGVDLNRNFPHRWRGGGSPFDTFYPGPRAASERETRAAMNLVRKYRPTRSIWYHQHMRCVFTVPKRPTAPQAYARMTGLPICGPIRARGTAIQWQNATDAAGTAFVVELASGGMTAAQVRRHAAAVAAI